MIKIKLNIYQVLILNKFNNKKEKVKHKFIENPTNKYTIKIITKNKIHSFKLTIKDIN